jgi:hypothetical protein
MHNIILLKLNWRGVEDMAEGLPMAPNTLTPEPCTYNTAVLQWLDKLIKCIVILSTF